MGYEIRATAFVRQRVYGRRVYEDGEWKCVGRTVRTWEVHASITYGVEITDLKSDALVYVGGVTRVTYRKRVAKPSAHVASRELVMAGCRENGEWTATYVLKGEFSYP